MFGGGSDAAGGIDDAMGKMDQLKASVWNVAGTALCSHYWPVCTDLRYWR